MTFHRSVNKTADAKPSVDAAQVERDYFQFAADASPECPFINFGPSGHQGTSLDGTFTEAHVFAITQAICDYRRSHNITGPLYLARSSHCLSRLAQRNALETLAGNNVQAVLQQNNIATPSPAISWAVLVHNRRRRHSVADGIMLAPLDDSAESSGIRYLSPTGSSDRSISKWIQDRAGELFREGLRGVKRALFSSAIRAASTHEQDFVQAYTSSLADAIDLNSIRAADLSLVVDSKGGATLPYWERIRDTYRLKITLVNSNLDSGFAFRPTHANRTVRTDCSARGSVTNLLALKDRYALSCQNNFNGELHAIVPKAADLLSMSDFLAIAIQYMLTNRPVWPRDSAVSKTFLASSLIDRVVQRAGHKIAELPCGFHWFAPGLLNDTSCFAADEAGGATFLCKDGSPWTTERDGILLALLGAEITARTGKNPAAHHEELAKSFGKAYRTTLEIPLTPDRKQALKQLPLESIEAREIAGEPVLAKFTRAPGNNESLGGLKIATANGWFAISTPGGPNGCQLWAESFIDPSHLDALVANARQIIAEIPPANLQVEKNRTR